MAGYSGTPLAKKLGIQAGCTLGLAGAPDGFPALLAPIPEGVRISEDERTYDLAVLFVTERDEVMRGFAQWSPRLSAAGALWFAWPKKASRVPTTITEDVLREVVLPTGWVDTKVCAIDDRWSGLKFVRRKEIRRTS